MKYIYGIDIGGTTIKMGLFAEDGTLKEKWEIKTRTEDNGKNIKILIIIFFVIMYKNTMCTILRKVKEKS